MSVSLNMNTREMLRFDDRWVRVLFIPLIGFLVPILFFGHRPGDGFSEFLPYWIISTIYSLLYWEGNRMILLKMRRIFPSDDHQKKRILRQSIFIFTYTLSVCFIVEHIQKAIFTEDVFRFFVDEPDYWQSQAAGLLFTIMVILMYEAVYFTQKYRESRLEAEQIKNAHVQSQLETLKNQVNPHFLFNSLNTLASIIPEDPEVAVEFVQKLSKVYRYILEIKDQQMISLEEELSFLHSYVFLLKIRHGDNLKVNIDIDPSVHQAKIVPLSLQLLIENAIKHNIMSNKKPLTIEVHQEGDHILVKNNLQRKNQVIVSTKTGLDNISKRYKLLTNKLIETIVTNSSFIVLLPLIQSDISHEGSYN